MGTSIVSFAADEFVTDRNWDHGRDEMNRNVLLKRCMRPSQTDRAPKVTILTNRDGYATGRCQLSTAPGLWPDPKGVVTVGSKAATGSVSMRLWNGSLPSDRRWLQQKLGRLARKRSLRVSSCR